MRISETWSEISESLNHQIIEAAYLHDKSLYRRLNQEMAKGLRKRTKGVLEMPRAQRHALYRP